MTGIRAVVFDMDGVLVDSAECHRAAFEEVFQPLGVRNFEYSRYAGWRTAEVIEHVLLPVVEGLTMDRIRQIAQQKSLLAREKLLTSNPVKDGCVPVLETLSSRFVLALASSASRESVELFMTCNQCAHLFRSVLSGGDVRLAKPAPEIYQRSFEALGIHPADGAVIEDAVSGVRAARAAGARAVIGLEGTSSSSELTTAGADFVVPSLWRLPLLLCSDYEDISRDGNQHR